MKKKIFVPKLYPLNRELAKTWFVKWVDAKGKTQKTYGNLNKLPTVKLREVEAQNIISKICNPAFTGAKRSYGLAQMLSNLVQYKKNEVSKKTYLCYDCIVNDFGLWQKLIAPKDALEIDYFNHLAGKGLHRNTIRNRHVILKGLCNELISREKINFNPFTKVKFKKIKATSKLPFSSNQAQILKDYMIENEPQLLLFCEFMYYLFLRPNEARQLKVMDILFDEWKVCLSGAIAKDKDVIYKAVPDQLKCKLLQFKNIKPTSYIFCTKAGESMPYKTVQQLHKKMLDKLNFSSRYSLYSWVHTGIKNAALSDIPIKALQLQKGHHDLNIG